MGALVTEDDAIPGNGMICAVLFVGTVLTCECCLLVSQFRNVSRKVQSISYPFFMAVFIKSDLRRSNMNDLMAANNTAAASSVVPQIHISEDLQMMPNDVKI